MTKRRDMGEELIASMREAVAIAKGEVEPARVFVPPAAVDVRAIRRRLHMSQQAFATRFGFSPATVRDWEQGRRQPEASARLLLLVIDRRRDAVEEVIGELQPG